jgi:hypothetical protein
MNGLPEKCDEAGLNEVLIVGKRFSEAAFPHDLEGRAIGEAPLLVSHSPVLAKRLRKLQRRLGDHFHVGIRPDRIDALNGKRRTGIFESAASSSSSTISVVSCRTLPSEVETSIALACNRSPGFSSASQYPVSAKTILTDRSRFCRRQPHRCALKDRPAPRSRCLRALARLSQQAVPR